MDKGKRGDVHGPHGDDGCAVHDNLPMPEDTLTHLKAWRKFRRMTQQQLADAVDPPTTKSVIAALESGQNGISAKWLHRLAAALQTSPGFLLDHDPNDLDSMWTAATEAVPIEKRADAIAILRVISKKD